MKKKKYHLTAKTANKYDLYEESVQNVDFEVEFISKIFKKKNKTDIGTQNGFLRHNMEVAKYPINTRRRKQY